jgi:formylglycine-generating enzyme required for sulfatase activity
MKKLFPILLVIALLSTACQLGGNKAGSERTSSTDGMIQVYVPQGTFQMGGLDPHAASDEKPVHKVELKGYWIDKVEVTNAMFLLCVQAGTCSPPQSISSESHPSYFNNAEFNDFPVVNVTWDSARQYCEWAGRRLPTEAEWEYAARGATVNTYPWGEDKPDDTRANFNYTLSDTRQVGSYPAGASPFGALDMAGNVFEWTNDFYDSKYYASGLASNPAGPELRTAYFNRVVRGGSYADPEVNVRTAKRASILGPNLDAELGARHLRILSQDRFAARRLNLIEMT